MDVRTEDLTWRRVAEDVVLLDLRRSTYLRLNPTGALLWERLVDGQDEPTLVAALVDECGVRPDRAADDVQAFITQLRESDLLV